MAVMTGGQAVVKALKAEGVEVVFGLPGVQMMHAYDAFFGDPAIRIITCRHEQATTYMADGYARSTGRVGVALVVPGPGVYNAGAGLATAYAASSPVLLIAGQVDSSEIGKGMGALHEIHDQLEVVRPVTKGCSRATAVGEVPVLVHEAVRQIRTGRPRPVAVEFPPDVLAATADLDIVEPEVYPLQEPEERALERAVALLASARRPAIWAGGGVNLANASEELTMVAELLGAPVVTTAEGKGAIAESHPLAMGASCYGWGPGRDVIPQADVVLAVGSRFGTYRREPEAALRPDQQLINLNVDEADAAKPFPPTVSMVADARVGLARLAAALRGRRRRSSWDPRALESAKAGFQERLRRVAPTQVAMAEAIRRAVPADGVVVAGVTNIAAWCYLAYPVLRPRTFLTSSYMGTLGYAFPTALGVKVGNPHKAVVALSGDGGFLYAAAELATAVAYGINVVVVVFNNHLYGASYRDQHLRFGGRVVGTQLHNPDFVRLAESFGVRGMKAKSLDGLTETIQEALEGEGPAVVEVEVPADLEPPYYLTPPPVAPERP